MLARQQGIERDLYPSRTLEKSPMFPRLDPVIHSQGAERLKGPLSEDELERFEREGFLFYPGFFNQEEIQACVEELARLSADPELRAGGGVILEPESEEVRSIFAIHRRSSHFQRLARDARVLGRIRQLLGSEAYVHQSRINYKPGFKGKGATCSSSTTAWRTPARRPTRPSSTAPSSWQTCTQSR
jgi:ectoine hydroxylase